MKKYDIVVIGAGHAGIEAAAAAARMGCQTLLITFDRHKIGALSCNPAIGGVGKGQLVKEVDALGGLMGELADAACIQFRLLNASKGPAVRSSRMQVDLEKYPVLAQQRLAKFTNLEIIEDEVTGIVVTGGSVQAVTTKKNGSLSVAAAVITPGTFFHGLIHIGHTNFAGGRLDDQASAALPENLAGMGIRFGRFKTGTTPRLEGKTIDLEQMTLLGADKEHIPFSRQSPHMPVLAQIACHITHTTLRTHALIQDNLKKSALYSGVITGTGVRYCPSIEDKIVKFPDKTSHHVFVEPESLETDRYYPNGTSNSLPGAIQNDLIHSIPGLEEARIVQEGYGIEHDYIDPTQLAPTLELQGIRGLYFAGQINGTTGYEEAAAQGLMAGINAARQVQQEEAVVLDRSQAYIGVLIDDLVIRGTNEPYRMFTSRVEYRLSLREDNADARLMPLGRALGLVTDAAFDRFTQRQQAITTEKKRLHTLRIKATEKNNALFAAWGSAPLRESIPGDELLRRTEITGARLLELDATGDEVPYDIRRAAEVEVKYSGYIKRQARDIARFRELERLYIPKDFVYKGLHGLSTEIIEKLSAIRPRTLGQASRVSGVTPAAITYLIAYLKARKG